MPACCKSLIVLMLALCIGLKVNADSLGLELSEGNNIVLLKSGEEKFADLFRSVAGARETIHMEYFNFRNDSIANALFDLLKLKAAEGVKVRLIYDDFGNASNNQPLKKYHLVDLRAANIEIYSFDPIRFPWVNHVFSRDHRKIVVIDDSIAYTGGMNVADYYIHGTEQVGEWHDLHCRIEGPVVEELQKIFYRTWYKTTGELLGVESGEWRVESEGSKVGIINREPRRSPKVIRRFYVQALDNAEREVRIINPYFTLIPSVKRAIKRAISRGVDVKILLSVKSDIPLTPDCGYYYGHKFMKRGASVWLFEPGFHHTKLMTVDGEYSTIGSANLNARSLRWDYEENIVVVDSAVTAELNELFDEQLTRSFYLDNETWKSFRTPWQRFRGWFASILSPFL